MHKKDGQLSLYPEKKKTISLIRNIMIVTLSLSYKRQIFCMIKYYIRKNNMYFKYLKYNSRLNIIMKIVGNDNDE